MKSYQLILEYEAKAIANIFGNKRPEQYGEEVGKLLNRQSKEEFYTVINIEFDRQNYHLITHLKNQQIHLNYQKQEIEKFIEISVKKGGNE